MKHTQGELFSAITHTVGLCLVPCIAWVIIWLGYTKNWEMAFGATFFTVGMLMMYIVSFEEDRTILPLSLPLPSTPNCWKYGAP